MAILIAIIAGISTISAIWLKWFLERPRLKAEESSRPTDQTSAAPASQMEPVKQRLVLYAGRGWDHRRRKSADFCVFWLLMIDAFGSVRGFSIIVYPGEEPHVYRLWGSVSGDSCHLHYEICGDAGPSAGCIKVDIGIDPGRLQGSFTGYSYRETEKPNVQGWVELHKYRAHVMV